MLGGSVAGLEYDENGNITGFSPEKFLAGFARGALGSKSLQFLTKKAQTSPKAMEILKRIQAKNATIPNQKFDKGKNMNLSIVTQDTKTITELRNNASIAIDKLLGKNIINKNDGRVAQISKNGRNKILSGAALRKSNENGFSKEEHFKASEHINELYENSTYLKSEPARNNSADIKSVHRYVSYLQINNKEAQALLTIKEIMEHGNKIYSLELQELRPMPKRSPYQTNATRTQG
ncbi:LPD3 domain-containing protein [Helicobacter sp. T3_23-1059]